MKIQTWIISGLLFFHCHMAAAVNLTVPFYNYQLNGFATIHANYSFTPSPQNPSFPIIFCYANDAQSINTITWPYNHVNWSAVMPTTLVTNSDLFEGELADGSGVITIFNTISAISIVSCIYGF